MQFAVRYLFGSSANRNQLAYSPADPHVFQTFLESLVLAGDTTYLRRKCQRRNRNRRRRHQKENSDPQADSSELLLSFRVPALVNELFPCKVVFLHTYFPPSFCTILNTTIHFHYPIFNFGSFLPGDACKSDRSRQELSNENWLRTLASIQPRTSPG